MVGSLFRRDVYGNDEVVSARAESDLAKGEVERCENKRWVGYLKSKRPDKSSNIQFSLFRLSAPDFLLPTSDSWLMLIAADLTL